jgi:hypothetical protein
MKRGRSMRPLVTIRQFPGVHELLRGSMVEPAGKSACRVRDHDQPAGAAAGLASNAACAVAVNA